jgi:hypothetical protein
MNALIFGDQTADQYPLLRKVSLRKDNALLSTFLERVSVVLRDEIEKLPRVQRAEIPDFLRVSDLVEAYFAKGLRIPQLESCMVTLAQLAHYIGYVARELALQARLISQVLRREPYGNISPFKHADTRIVHGAARRSCSGIVEDTGRPTAACC